MKSTRSTVRNWAASLLLVAAATVAVAPAVAQRSSATPVIVSRRVSKPVVAETPREIIAQYATGHILMSDRLYRGNGNSFEPVPVWNPEPAQITSSGTLADGTWRVYIRTASGITGYVDVAHPNQLSLYLKRAGSN